MKVSSDQIYCNRCDTLPQVGTLILIAAVMFSILGGITLIAHIYTLNIKAKTVGNGQHGTARWASKREIAQTYARVPFTPEQWRRRAAAGKPPAAESLPQGIVVGCKNAKGKRGADDGES